ncbi:MAG: hypothetical protein HOE90_02210 [Bacteriovoracaceae bacterium]|mgnify:CR=1 FL=1|jgi:hypothetical protein|nr:hypothetical protein [Bacteriovoracaceae bacterium]
MKLINCAIFFLLVNTSCSTTQNTEKKAFEYGSYKHNVSVTLPDGKTHRTNGIFRYSDGDSALVALSPVGTTLFEVSQHGESIEAALYFKFFGFNQNKLEKLFKLLLKIHSLPYRERSQLSVAELGQLTIAFSKQRIIKNIPRFFTIKVKNTVIKVDITHFRP